MGPTLSALVPVFLVIALGVVLRRTLLREAAHWAALEQITYFVLFPALLVVSAVKADLTGVSVGALFAAMFGTVAAMSALMLAVRRPLVARLGMDGPAFTSLFQGVTRWNTYVALAVAGGLFGPSGVTAMAVTLVGMIPVVNVICVVVLARHAGSRAPTPRFILGQLARNPFIWSCLAGALLNIGAVPVPQVAVEFGDILGKASLALGLLVVGGGLDLRQMASPKAEVLLAVGLRLVLMPLVAVPLGLALGLRGMELAVLAIACGVPAAPTAYVLARQMGGNAALMAEILTAQIIAAALTLPAVVLATAALAP